MTTEQMKTEWNFKELPKGSYCASVNETPRGRWMFRVLPDMGGCCGEAVFDTKEEACQCGNDYAAGRKTALTSKMYSASF